MTNDITVNITEFSSYEPIPKFSDVIDVYDVSIPEESSCHAPQRTHIMKRETKMVRVIPNDHVFVAFIIADRNPITFPSERYADESSMIHIQPYNSTCISVPESLLLDKEMLLLEIRKEC